jgi:hypothetical protein
MRISRQSISWTDYIKNEEGLHEVEERCWADQNSEL